MNLDPAKACEHEANHRQIDHRFAGLGLPFVVPTEAAVAAQPAEGSLDDPASWQHFERMEFGAFDDLDRATPPCATPRQQRSGVAALGPDRLDRRRGTRAKKAASSGLAPARS